MPRNPRDQAAWFLKCRALTSKQWIDDVETLGPRLLGGSSGKVGIAKRCRFQTSMPCLRVTSLPCDRTFFSSPARIRIDEEGVADLLLDEPLGKHEVQRSKLQSQSQKLLKFR